MAYPANLSFEIIISIRQPPINLVCLADHLQSDLVSVMMRHVLQDIRNPLIGCFFAKKRSILLNLTAIHALSWLGFVYESFPVNEMRNDVIFAGVDFVVN